MIKTEHLVIIGLLLFSSVILVVMYIRTRPGWSCTEKGCEQSMGGKYKNKAECDTACATKLSSAKKEVLDKWACKNWACVPSSSGFDTQDDCVANCPLPFVSTFQPAMSDWGFAWSNRYRMPGWARPYWIRRPGGGWRHR
jgi:hypothetical protein